MACLPTNSVATFASKGANISALAINCLGSLYVVAKNEIEINSPADLIGKNVGVVMNLAPRAMMGGKYTSEGMIFAADTEDGAASIAFYPDSTLGKRIH